MIIFFAVGKPPGSDLNSLEIPYSDKLRSKVDFGARYVFYYNLSSDEEVEEGKMEIEKKYEIFGINELLPSGGVNKWEKK